MSTPEGKVKDKVKKLLREYGAYQFWPVQMGMGAAGLDCHAYISQGEFAEAFFVEVKKYDAAPTLRQQMLIDEHIGRGARCFVIDNDLSLDQLEKWLQQRRK